MLRRHGPVLLTAAVALAVWGLAIWLRWRDLSATMVLGDSGGPLMVAVGDGWRPHAPPYGWGLYLPHVLILAVAGSLQQAFAALAMLHALAAPLASLAVLRLRAGAHGAALAAGVVVALDRGLLDTTTSGAEGYLAATWLAALTLGLAARSQAWGPWLAAVAWAFAVMCHPFALAAGPLLLILPRRRSSLGALALAALLLAPRIVAALSGPAPQAEGNPWLAPDAWFRQGGLSAWAILGSGLLGLVSRRTRALSLAALASLVLMLLLGHHLDYLRDHHLRLLTVPLVVGLAALPGWWGLLALALVRVPPSWAAPEGFPERPGTLGMATDLADAIVARALPVTVDGAWISGVSAAEPATVMLDLHLRGHPLGAETVAVVVSAEGRLVRSLAFPGEVLSLDDLHALVLVPATQLPVWRTELCDRGARLGGARDGLLVLAPELSLPPWEDCSP